MFTRNARFLATTAAALVAFLMPAVAFSSFPNTAITVEFLSDRTRVGIHIADVAHFVGSADILDEEAFRRGATIYLPSRSVHLHCKSYSYVEIPVHIVGN